MNRKIEAQILEEYINKGSTYRSLAKKYGYSYGRIYRLVQSKKEQHQQIIEEKAVEERSLPDDVKTLKEELHKALLKIELQDFMLDISSKELEIDLRKKHGTRQSK